MAQAKSIIPLKNPLKVKTQKGSRLVLEPATEEYEVVLKVMNPSLNQMATVTLNREDIREIEHLLQVAMCESCF